jgi:hypothetical protein
MRRLKQEGRGRLVPTRQTGIAYKVRYGIHIVEAPKKHGRELPTTEWAECSVQFEHGGQLPDGSYYLYTDEGQVHQLKSTDGKWKYLAVAA